MEIDNPFKRCPCCFQAWQTRDDFLKDTALKLNGYKADFEKLEYGLFFFTHLQPECNSTLALEVSDFIDLYKGERYLPRRTGETECPGFCLDKNQLERCDAICECAFVREILQVIRSREIA
ncbi:hypothetical protein [uncultured Desulfosarcina sp.]|uniref:hypothetical protein n=1 Tax=uncultured Desulfosarcina sp. TaxID=218289 RepID=UPI0029C6A98D|nr:hypothetical protein [uncultured Desulfosarcina sp.]